jgi:hypothetical protein
MVIGLVYLENTKFTTESLLRSKDESIWDPTLGAPDMEAERPLDASFFASDVSRPASWACKQTGVG